VTAERTISTSCRSLKATLCMGVGHGPVAGQRDETPTRMPEASAPRSGARAVRWGAGRRRITDLLKTVRWGRGAMSCNGSSENQR
jgi:hypothetical protein